MEELRKIKKHLPKGAQKRVAKKLRISQDKVSRVMRGKTVDVEVLQALYREAERHARIVELAKQLP